MDRAVLSVLAVSILLTAGAMVYTYKIAFFDGRRGILLKFSTFPGVKTKMAPLGAGVDWRRVEVQVTAIHSGNGSLITLFTGFLNWSELFLNAQEPTFRDVLKSYVPMHVESLSTCLMLDVWIFLENGTVLEARPPIGVPIQPIKALGGLVLKDVVINPQKMIRKCSTYQQSPAEIELANGSIKYEWKPVSDYSYYSNLTDVPLLIVTNPRSNSGVIWWIASVDPHEATTFRMTASYGIKIIDQAPTVNLTTYSEGWTMSERYIFGRSDDAFPDGSSWSYIKAKFAHVHEKELCLYKSSVGIIGEEPTGQERIMEYIYSVQLEYGDCIVGGEKDGLPQQNIMEWFYNGTQEERLIIPGTPLSDGDLDVEEYWGFYEIFNFYHKHNKGFGGGIPIGAMAAALGGFPRAYSGLISGLTVLINGGVMPSTGIFGAIGNRGESYEYGYNVSELIYMGISKYRYTSKSGYTYKVPAGIYFKCV